MSVADWIVAVVGVALWVWLLRQIVNPNGYFDRVMSPPEGKAS